MAQPSLVAPLRIVFPQASHKPLVSWSWFMEPGGEPRGGAGEVKEGRGWVGLWVGHSQGWSWAVLPRPLHLDPLWQRLGHVGAVQLSLLAPSLMVELQTQHLPLGVGGAFDSVGLGDSWEVGVEVGKGWQGAWRGRESAVGGWLVGGGVG